MGILIPDPVASDFLAAEAKLVSAGLLPAASGQKMIDLSYEVDLITHDVGTPDERVEAGYRDQALAVYKNGGAVIDAAMRFEVCAGALLYAALQPGWNKAGLIHRGVHLVAKKSGWFNITPNRTSAFARARTALDDLPAPKCDAAERLTIPQMLEEIRHLVFYPTENASECLVVYREHAILRCLRDHGQVHELLHSAPLICCIAAAAYCSSLKTWTKGMVVRIKDYRLLIVGSDDVIQLVSY